MSLHVSPKEETRRMKQCKACTVSLSYKSSQTCLSWRGGTIIPLLQPLCVRLSALAKHEVYLKGHVHLSASHNHKNIRYGFCKWHLMPYINVQKELRWKVA